jgi:hypothetical protein
MSCPCHFWKVSSGVFEYPKSATRENLWIHAVVTICREQFESAQHAERIEQVATQFVLSAFAAVQRHQQGGDALPSRLQRQHSAVFIVGMRGRLHQASGGLQTAKH